MSTKIQSSRNLGFAIFLNSTIVIAQYLGGLFSGSLALMSDAGHNFSDVVSLTLSYFGEKLSKEKANGKYSFGLKRIEVATAFINGAVLCLMSFVVITETIRRAGTEEPIVFEIMLPVSIIGLLGNFLSVLLLRKDKNHNLNIKAAYVNLFYDTLSSIFVIIVSILIATTGLRVFDLTASVVIAVMMLLSGFQILKSTSHILIQGVPAKLDFNEVYQGIGSVDGVSTVHDLHIWSVDSEEVFLSCHVCISRRKSASEVDKIVHSISKFLKENYKITHTAIQFEHKKKRREDICFK